MNMSAIYLMLSVAVLAAAAILVVIANKKLRESRENLTEAIEAEDHAMEATMEIKEMIEKNNKRLKRYRKDIAREFQIIMDEKHGPDWHSEL